MLWPLLRGLAADLPRGLELAAAAVPQEYARWQASSERGAWASRALESPLASRTWRRVGCCQGSTGILNSDFGPGSRDMDLASLSTNHGRTKRQIKVGLFAQCRRSKLQWPFPTVIKTPAGSPRPPSFASSSPPAPPPPPTPPPPPAFDGNESRVQGDSILAALALNVASSSRSPSTSPVWNMLGLLPSRGGTDFETLF